MRTIYFIIYLVLLLTSTLSTFSQGRFKVPIEGIYGKDYIIVNYVDWGPGTTYSDNHCLDKTYDGHQGTDFTIRDFSAMDSGVYVIAADTGVVIFTQDGIFDREKKSVISKQLGNYIGISHTGKFQTYYGHLKKNSLLVSVGDTVYPGMRIGQVGSSGNSTSPHLHFELWYDSLYYIDPFKGPCGNPGTYWEFQNPFDSTFQVWNHGLINFQPTLDTLKEGLAVIDTFYSTDSAISFWSLKYGLRKDDSLKIKWTNPNNQEWFQFNSKLNQNWWYYYYWSYIDIPITGKEGLWKVELFRNNKRIIEKEFYYYNKKHTRVESFSENSQIIITSNLFQWSLMSNSKIENVRLFNLAGELIGKYDSFGYRVDIPKQELPSGIYIAIMYNHNETKTLKLFKE